MIQNYASEMTIRKFFFFALAYSVFSMTVAAFAQPLGFQYVLDSLFIPKAHGRLFLAYLPGVLSFVACMYAFRKNGWNTQRIGDLIIALPAIMVFTFSFSLFKTTMPQLSPFWADPFFADLDRALHFGTDPWVFLHNIMPNINPDHLMTIYLKLWTLPAIFAPVLLVLVDKNLERVGRFLTLHIFVWVGLGNVVAFTFLSSGPVYYDRIFGGETYAALTDALSTSGANSGRLGYLQEWLWRVYSGEVNGMGSGISAFPSVHVAVTTSMALYLRERSMILGVLGFAYLMIIMFLSIYIGFHYAIDGYFSMAAVWLVWRLTKPASAPKVVELSQSEAQVAR